MPRRPFLRHRFHYTLQQKSMTKSFATGMCTILAVEPCLTYLCSDVWPVQDTGSGLRLVDHVDVALGDILYTAAADDIMNVLAGTKRPNVQHQHPRIPKAGTPPVPTSLQSQIVQAVTSLQRYRDRLPVKAAFTCRSITVSVPTQDAETGSAIPQISGGSATKTCLLHIRLTPAETDVQRQSQDGNVQSLDRKQNSEDHGSDLAGTQCGASFRPSQAGDALMQAVRPSALRVELHRLPDAAESSSSANHASTSDSEKQTADHTAGSAADEVVDRSSDGPEASSSVLVRAAHNVPGLVLNCTAGQLLCSVLGNGLSVQTAGVSSISSVRKVSCAKPGMKVGTLPQPDPCLSIDTTFSDVRLACLCGTLAQFDRDNRIVEQISRVATASEAIVVPKPVDGDGNAEAAAEPAISRKSQLEAMSAGGLPGVDWQAKVSVAQGFCLRVLHGTDCEAEVMSGERPLGIPQASFQMESLQVEAAGGFEHSRSAASITAGGAQPGLGSPASLKQPLIAELGSTPVADASYDVRHNKAAGMLS